jgi:N-methylhydantoinase A
MDSGYRVAADIGGTFTDIVLVTREGTIATKKLLSTPANYAQAVIRGVMELTRDLGLPMESISDVLHGCTVATNAILENKGAKTALLTTKGFRDVLELRRIRMPRLYDLSYIKPEPLVPRHLRFEVEERIGPHGEVLIPLNQDDVYRAIEKIKRAGVEAVAVTFLHSYANPEHERIAGQILREELGNCFLSLSVEVLPEIREYERTSTTVINSYVGPPVKRYLQSLRDQLQGAGVKGRLLVMQSGGGIIESKTAIQRPAEIVECGPAAGVIGSAYLGRLTGYPNIITLDMGGTTAKASIVEGGRLVKTDEYEVGGGISLSSRLVKGGGYALKIPVIDISEVGAGGGSIIWFDKAGVLKVGPQSAGADPGPVCYSLGGKEPTITDANVVLGYLNPKSLAGGSVPIEAEKAWAVIEEKVARPLGQSLEEAAFGIHTVSNAIMMRAIKAVTTYRGRDPRDFVLFAFGGSGGVHAVELARALGIKRVVIPPVAGVFSALGLLVANVEIGLARAFLCSTLKVPIGEINRAYRSLEEEVQSQLGYQPERITFHRLADLRYSGQAYELSIPVPIGKVTDQTIRQMEEAFEKEHEKTYGHCFPGHPKETVSLRVIGSVVPDDVHTIDLRQRVDRKVSQETAEVFREAYFGPEMGERNTPVLSSRDALGREFRPGPQIIEEYEGTIVITPDAQAALDEWGNILIDVSV